MQFNTATGRLWSGIGLEVKKMKFYGYPSDVDLPQPLSLSEVSFLGSEESLREIARFLVRCADEIANTPAVEGVDLHFHLREYSNVNEFEGDLVVVPISK